ncbi:hypothetical protein GCM10010123_25250 [Pilimelia anulata]|uniref:Signal peptidase I n=1 Tax=Pilimelia anulata TaxID=53371 RepID=A0A8J3B941_9ACTN|nr:signal peptidase I [Pilimelia anulata]GGJ94365.1 hypothetical protein GCM10010123_25250 [Pilimelia anulata]
MIAVRSPGPDTSPARGRLGALATDAARVVLSSTLMAVFTLLACVLAPLTWGWHAYTVTSGSMQPLVRPGDVVLASTVDPRRPPDVGAVVVLSPIERGRPPITHRVVERLPDGRYRTKGDANRQPDARLVDTGQIIGRARLVVPLIGLVPLRLGPGAPVLGVLVVLGSLAAGLVARHRRARPPTPPATAAAGLAAVVLLAAAGTVATGSRAAWVGTSGTPAHTWVTSDFYYEAMVASAPASYWRLGGNNATSAPDVMGAAAMALVNTPTVGRPGALRGDPDTAMGFFRAPAISYGTVTSAAHSFAGSMTVAAWSRVSGVTSNWRLVFKGTSGNLNYLLSWDTSGNNMRFLVDPAATSRVTATGAYPAGGAWHFIVGSYDGAFVRLYVDGQQLHQVALTGALKTNANALTVSENNASTGMIGDVDEVAVWGRALSAGEINHLWTIGHP